MKFIQSINGKELPFSFNNKAERQEYIAICEIIWGSVPCDVNWATGTDIYKKAKARYDEGIKK